MFIESPEYVDRNTQHFSEASYEVVLCHMCAHALCDNFPGIARLIDPHTSHTHTDTFWKDHPDHEGVDKPDTAR